MSDDWIGTIYASIVSLASVALGVLIRYSHQARRAGEKIDWVRMRYEIPTVFGLAIIVGPASEYVTTTFGVDQGVLAATAVCMGYLGTRVLDIFSNFLEKKADDED